MSVLKCFEGLPPSCSLTNRRVRDVDKICLEGLGPTAMDGQYTEPCSLIGEFWSQRGKCFTSFTICKDSNDSL